MNRQCKPGAFAYAISDNTSNYALSFLHSRIVMRNDLNFQAADPEKSYNDTVWHEEAHYRGKWEFKARQAERKFKDADRNTILLDVISHDLYDQRNSVHSILEAFAASGELYRGDKISPQLVD